MSNLIIEGMAAVAEIVKSMTSSSATEEKAAELRKSLDKMTKAQLIEMIVAEKSKNTQKEPTQRDLLCAILKDARAYALDYNEISETILANMNTKLKYSPANIAWYKSQLATEGEELVERMPTAERRKLDRQIAMQALKSIS